MNYPNSLEGLDPIFSLKASTDTQNSVWTYQGLMEVPIEYSNEDM